MLMALELISSKQVSKGHSAALSKHNSASIVLPHSLNTTTLSLPLSLPHNVASKYRSMEAVEAIRLPAGSSNQRMRSPISLTGNYDVSVRQPFKEM